MSARKNIRRDTLWEALFAVAYFGQLNHDLTARTASGPLLYASDHPDFRETVAMRALAEADAAWRATQQVTQGTMQRLPRRREKTHATR